MGLSVVAPSRGTCKIQSGYSTLDYLLVSMDILPLVSDISVVPDVPWGPHVGITFSINARPRSLKHWQIQQPLPLRFARDADDKVCKWEVTEQEWQNAKADSLPACSSELARATSKHPHISGYAEQLGILDLSYSFALRNLAWSRAA